MGKCWSEAEWNGAQWYGSGVFLVQKYIYIYLLFIKPLVLYCKSLERAFILHAKNPCFLFIYFREPNSVPVAHQCTSGPPVHQRPSGAPVHQRHTNARTSEPAAHQQRQNGAAPPAVPNRRCERRFQWCLKDIANGASSGTAIVSRTRLKMVLQNAPPMAP